MIPLVEFVTDFRIGGTERQVVNLATRLDPGRFELHMACFRREGQLLPEIEARRAPFNSYGIRTLASPLTLRQQLRLARYIRSHGIQLVHCYGFYPNVFAVPAARLAGTPVVVASIRDTGDHLTPLQKRIQRWACRLADRVLVNAEAVRGRLIAEGYAPERIEVIRNGIALERFRRRPDVGAVRGELGLPERAPLVAVLARLTGLKGIEYFLDAAAAVARLRPDARFMIVGDGGCSTGTSLGYRGELERYAERLGIRRRVVFTGFRSDVPDLLAETAVSVLPSLSEGLSNTVLESMAAGVPVVATDVGGNPEMVRDGVTGLLVPPRDAAALAAAIGRLLADQVLARRLSEAGKREVAERFSVEAMVRDTEALYGSLLAERGVVEPAPGQSPPAGERLAASWSKRS